MEAKEKYDKQKEAATAKYEAEKAKIEEEDKSDPEGESCLKTAKDRYHEKLVADKVAYKERLTEIRHACSREGSCEHERART